jgi:2-deoxy-D-gluconate 3-dehydrogenase
MSSDLFDLTGKSALVTGSSTGLGRAFAVALAEHGASIVGVARRSQDETKRAVESVGGRFVALQADLAEDGAAEHVVKAAAAAFGRLDILVNNAGMIERAPAMDTTDASWDKTIELDLSSLFRLSRAAARRFKEQGADARGVRGKIINTGSVLSFQGGILVAAYAAAKHGVVGLTRALANEWASEGINVNAIAPGYYETELTEAIRADPARSSALLARVPAGRFGKPDDLKGVVVFLASAASDYVHGETIAVDGGWLAR